MGARLRGDGVPHAGGRGGDSDVGDSTRMVHDALARVSQPHVAELGARGGSVLGARQGEAVHAAPRRVGRRTPRRRDAPRERHQPQAQPPGAAAGGAGVSSGSSSI